MSAPNIAGAPLPQRARRFWETRFGGLRGRLEAFLERERGQLPPWFVVGFGTGIAAWFMLGEPRQWAAFPCLAAGMAVAGFSLSGGRAERAAGWFGLWWLTGLSLDLLLGLAHRVADSRGAVVMMAAMPPWALGMMIAGGLWLFLWTTRPRLWGLAPILLGALAAAVSPTPDLLTGDGRHLALVDQDGTPLLLRERSGEFIRSIVADSAGFDAEPEELASRPFASCSRDSCIARIDRGGRSWQILATRSAQSIEWLPLVRACAEADIVVSSRWLPRGCTPRWLKLDRDSLARTGAVAIYLGNRPRAATVAERVGKHPWAAEIPRPMRYAPRSTRKESVDAPIRLGPAALGPGHWLRLRTDFARRTDQLSDQTASSLPAGSMK